MLFNEKTSQNNHLTKKNMFLPVFEVCLEGPAGALLRLGSGGGCLRLVALDGVFGA